MRTKLTIEFLCCISPSFKQKVYCIYSIEQQSDVEVSTEVFAVNPFNPDFTLSSSSTTSRESLPQFSTCSGWRWFKVGEKIKENYHVLVNQFHGNFNSKTLACRKIKSVFRDVKWCFNASWGLKGLNESKGIYGCLLEYHTFTLNDWHLKHYISGFFTK